MRKLLVTALVAVIMMTALGVTFVFGRGEPEQEGTGSATQSYDIEFLLTETEYTAQIGEILRIYERENPNISFTISGWTEGQDAVYEARIAAGDPPHLFVNAPANPITKNRFEFMYNLLEVDYPYWDRFTFDVRNSWGDIFGVDDYLPILPMWMPVNRTFIYHADELAKAGLDPKETVRTWDDLREFLAELKEYVDSRPDVDYVFDLGWNSNGFSRCFPIHFTTSLASLDGQYEVWEGNIDWTDTARNPYVGTFRMMKEFYDLGYFPEQFWTRQWEPDFEAGFIAKRSLLAWHGPWLWDKALAADPNVQLDGFPLPANSEGLVGCDSFVPDNGVGIFKAHEGEPIFQEVKKFFVWYNSPEIIKLRAEVRGRPATFDLNDVGQPDIQGLQYTHVVKPFNEGYFGDIGWDLRLWPDALVGQYKVDGTPNVFRDDAMAAVWGDYMEGRISLARFLSTMQSRWEAAFDFSE